MGRTIISNDECFEWDEEKAITNKKNMVLSLKKL